MISTIPVKQPWKIWVNRLRLELIGTIKYLNFEFKSHGFAKKWYYNHNKTKHNKNMCISYTIIHNLMSWKHQGISKYEPMVQKFVEANHNENMKATHYCPFVKGIHLMVDSPHKKTVMQKSFQCHCVIAVYLLYIYNFITKWCTSNC